MELPVMMHGKNVGCCVLQESGLYWELQCRCDLVSDLVERIYVGEKKLGVLEKYENKLCMNKRVSKSSCPELPPVKGYFTLHPEVEEQPEHSCEDEIWEGEILGYHLKGKRDGEWLLFPYDESEPCPCEPLLCYFEVKDGYWRIPVDLPHSPQLETNIESY